MEIEATMKRRMRRRTGTGRAEHRQNGDGEGGASDEVFAQARVDSARGAISLAERIGYPVMLKTSD